MVTKEVSCNLGLGGVSSSYLVFFIQELRNFLVPQGDGESKEQVKARSTSNITPLWQQSNMEISSQKFKGEQTRCFFSYLL